VLKQEFTSNFVSNLTFSHWAPKHSLPQLP